MCILTTLTYESATEYKRQFHRGVHLEHAGTWKNIPVAVKTMLLQPKGKGLDKDPGLREATLALQLVHPNLVATYRANARMLENRVDQGGSNPKKGSMMANYQLFMLQEYCDSGTMYDWLASTKLHPGGVTDKVQPATRWSCAWATLCLCCLALVCCPFCITLQ
jgi:serine/threonine protein kinase